jgi:hypothetical protein
LDGSIGDEAGDIGRQTTASAANQEEEEDLDLKYDLLSLVAQGCGSQ